MNNSNAAPVAAISSHRLPTCGLCGAPGELFYHGLKDRLFGAPGEWNLKRCANPGCGLVWLDPMPLPEEIYKAYQNYYTHQNGRSRHNSWLRNIRALKDRLTKEGYLSRKYGYRFDGSAAWNTLLSMVLYLEPNRKAYVDLGVMYQRARPQGLLLDVGCGNGSILAEMAALGWQVEGVDPDRVAVEKVRKKGFKVRQGDLQSQNYPENSFDTVSLCHVIEHAHDPLGLLKECYRILKPGGNLVVITPNIESWGHRLFRDSWLGLDPPRHLYLFSLPLLRHLAAMASFGRAILWTSVREAEQNFIASRFIGRNGKYNFMGGEPQTKALKLWARSLYLVEWLILKARPHWGEEIVAILEK
jgi:2-polyprenyl-3-methyl-5-hydroxy-6-metoxy-1,4-benzoquinol methylase